MLQKFPKDVTLYRAAAVLFLLIGGTVGLLLSFRYLIPVFLPFLLAWLLSLAVRPIVSRIAGERRILRGIVTALLVILLVGLSVFGLIKGCERGVTELGRLMERLAADSETGGFFSELSGWMTSLSEHLPFLDRFSEHPAFDQFCAVLDEAVRTAAESALKLLGEKIPAFLMSLVSRLPSVLIFLTSLLLSCYYFSADIEKPGERLGRLLPEHLQTSFYIWRIKLQKALTQYLRAYIILGLLTFAEMLLGLTILQVPYAFLLAAVISLVDFLPLLGAGTILVPWALICFIAGNGGQATGLLILFGIHTLFRQVAEPRLVSRELGLSPLTSLIAVYAGWQIMGVGGMLIAPLVAMVIKELLNRKEDEPQGAVRDAKGGTMCGTK